MIPAFPKFKQLSLSHQNIWPRFVAHHPPYSDFNFVSLWIYNLNDDCEVSTLNDNLVIKFHDYISFEPFLSFIGNKRPTDTINKLINYSAKQNLEPKLRLIPATNIKKKSLKEKFIIKPDIDNFDYIFNTEHKTKLQGKKYFNRRKIINKFKNRFSKHEMRIIDIAKPSIKKQVKNLVHHWADSKKNDEEEEIQVMNRLLDSSHHFDLKTLGIYHDRRLVSFITTEFVSPDYAIAHYGKSDLSLLGLTPYTSHKTAEFLYKNGIRYLNYEQDLGLKGLAKSKKMWHPHFFLKKYTIKPHRQPHIKKKKS